MIQCDCDTLCNRQAKGDGKTVCTASPNACGWQNNTPSKTDIFEGLLDKLLDTYRRKNHDYADSYAKLREKYPISILIRLTDKLNRLETLINHNQQMVKDESINDTLQDMACYCLLELVERKILEEEIENE
jgi:hypothetical protein